MTINLLYLVILWYPSIANAAQKFINQEYEFETITSISSWTKTNKKIKKIREHILLLKKGIRTIYIFISWNTCWKEQVGIELQDRRAVAHDRYNRSKMSGWWNASSKYGKKKEVKTAIISEPWITLSSYSGFF